MNNSSKADIDYRFKILYAIATIMIVCGHVGGGLTILNDWFPYNGLHVAIFAFSSGYFYKCSEEKNIMRYIFKKTKRLIIPLYLYNMIRASKGIAPFEFLEN